MMMMMMVHGDLVKFHVKIVNGFVEKISMLA